jgi:hypothetical protein
VVTGAVPGDTVATAAHRYAQFILASEQDAGHDVLSVPALCDERRLAIDHAVPHQARRVVSGVVWLDEPTVESLFQLL